MINSLEKHQRQRHAFYNFKMCQTLHLMYKYYENLPHPLHKTMQKWKELSVISALWMPIL